MKCEKKWFNDIRLRKLGMSSANSSDSDVATEAEGPRIASPSPPGWGGRTGLQATDGSEEIYVEEGWRLAVV